MQKYYWAFWVFILGTHSVFGQFKNIMLDDGAGTGGKLTPCEPSVAISLKNKNHIVASAILDKIYYTKDGGKTWTKSRLKSPYGVWGDPVVISDTKGHFYYFHLSDPTGRNWQSEEILDRIVCQKSKNVGKKWSKGTYMGYNPPKDQDKEWAVVNPQNNHIYATWTQFDKYDSKDPKDESNILFSKSENGGKSWSKPLIINEIAGDCLDGDQTTEGAVPAVGTKGEIYVSWSYDSKIYFDKSLDGGKTWLDTDLIVAEQQGGWDINIDGVNRSNGMPVTFCDLSNSKFRGTVYINWADQRNGENDTDIWLAKSIDGGKTWSESKRVNDDKTTRQQYLTWMTIDQTTGYLYTIFYDRRNYDDLQTDVYLAYSTDGGETFKNVKISEKSFTANPDVFFGDYNHISAHDGRIVPVWTRADDGKTSVWTTIIEHSELEKLVETKQK